MGQRKVATTRNRREGDRESLSGEVAIEFPEAVIVGPGENVSDEGLFFVTDQTILVGVSLPGEAGVRRGQVVRVQSLGDGKFGLAVKFV